MLTLRLLLKTTRPKQWTKNAIVFFPFMFTLGEYWRPFTPDMYRMLGLTLAAFVLFCVLSGCVYLINDLVDIEKDRLHPTKRRRPLAAGELEPTHAVAAAVVLLATALPVSFYLSLRFGVLAVTYFGVMLAYSYWLKNQVIVDVFTVAAGFVLRALAGAVVIDVRISPWLFVITILLSLFLGFSKRRHELVLLEGNATDHRSTLAEYSPQLLDEMIGVVAAATVIAYSLYTFTAENLPPNHEMMLTIPFVLYGIFRYLYLIHVKNAGGSPEEILLKDRPLLGAILMWGLAVVGILYFFGRYGK